MRVSNHYILVGEEHKQRGRSGGVGGNWLGSGIQLMVSGAPSRNQEDKKNHTESQREREHERSWIACPA